MKCKYEFVCFILIIKLLPIHLKSIIICLIWLLSFLFYYRVMEDSGSTFEDIIDAYLSYLQVSSQMSCKFACCCLQECFFLMFWNLLTLVIGKPMGKKSNCLTYWWFIYHKSSCSFYQVLVSVSSSKPVKCKTICSGYGVLIQFMLCYILDCVFSVWLFFFFSFFKDFLLLVVLSWSSISF